MARSVVTAAELEAMTPAQQQEHFDRCVVNSLADVPVEFIEKVRGRLRRHIDAEAGPNEQ